MPIADGQMRNSAGYVLAEIIAIMSNGGFGHVPHFFRR